MNYYSNLVDAYQESFRKNASLPAISDYFSKTTYTYFDVAKRIAKIHVLLESVGVSKGDHIALIGKNNSNWVVTYLGVLTYGAVVVPILPNFSPDDITNLINHSEAKLLFIDGTIWKSVSSNAFEQLKGVVDVDFLRTLSDYSGEVSKTIDDLDNIFLNKYPNFSIEDIEYDHVATDNLAIISYTSGTSGFIKGVMLTVRNLTFVVQFALDHKFHQKGSKVLSLLPLAHAYGCAFDMLTPLSIGSHITLLGKTPNPTVLLDSMKAVKPDLLCTVPLVMEKIVHKKIFPILEKKPVKLLVKCPLTRGIIYKYIRKSMLDSFGGRLKEVNMGGAALAKDVEEFLMAIKFPFTVGYGMTECAPLVSYMGWKEFVPGSCGRLLPGMQAKILPLDTESCVGEICLKGNNVMKGYFKNPEATAEAIDSEGWLHTGDVGSISADNVITLNGRCKNMILSSDGQNIYPEAIESKLNECAGVSESLVVEEKGRLVALVVPDFDLVKDRGWEEVKELMDNNLKILNEKLASYERISIVKLCEEAFEKTPKQSIRRYLYPKAAKIKML